jgi:hypothetical protein
MRFGDAIYLVCGVWGLVSVAVLISAIRLSYRIEARSEGLKNRSGIPRNAMIFHTVLNLKVARDDETQSLRRAMNRRLLIIAAGFALLWGGIWWAGLTG